MSGGSYNYLYSKDADALLTRTEDLTSMRDRLVELGAPDVAGVVGSIMTAGRRYRVETDAQLDRIQDVLRAVEWLDSNDWSESRVWDALEKYRAVETEAEASGFPVRLPFGLGDGQGGRYVDLLLFESGGLAWDAAGYKEREAGRSTP